ncbi:MAG TPA: hypothetical protein VJT31_12385 [Rugosimonospora sp.]|nr:hypothetical protein [Rugosimonospora sp.]
MALVVALAAFTYVLPKPESHAADLSGIQYEPGTATVNTTGSTCQVVLPITASAPDNATANNLHEIVSNDQAQTGLSGDRVFLSPGPLDGTKVYFAAYLDGVSCADVGQGTATVNADRSTAGRAVSTTLARATAPSLPTLRTVTADLVTASSPNGAPVELVALPKWAKIAIAGLAAAAIFVGITIAVGAGLEAAIGAGAATTVTGAALSGCVGGAVSTAANNLITGAAKTTTDNVSSAVVGCLTGGITAQLGPYLKPLAEKLGGGLRGLLGLAPAQLGGTVLEEVATTAAVDVSGPTIEMTTAAAQGAERVASS